MRCLCWGMWVIKLMNPHHTAQHQSSSLINDDDDEDEKKKSKYQSKNLQKQILPQNMERWKSSFSPNHSTEVIGVERLSDISNHSLLTKGCWNLAEPSLGCYISHFKLGPGSVSTNQFYVQFYAHCWSQSFDLNSDSNIVLKCLKIFHWSLWQ